MRISDWSSDVCSSDLAPDRRQQVFVPLTDGDCGADVLHVSAQKLANSPFEKLSWPACAARHRGGRKTALTRPVGQPLLPVSSNKRFDAPGTKHLVRQIKPIALRELGRASRRERVCPDV